MRRTLVLFISLVVLWAVVTQLNHMVSGMRIYVFAGALFVAFAALTQPLISGMAASMLAALVFDAHTPVPFGTHFLLFSIAHVMVYRFRERIPRDDTVSQVMVTVLANLGLFLAFSFSQMLRSPAVSSAWTRLLVDLGCSQVFLAVVTPWFFALQSGALAVAGVDRDDSA